MNKSSGWRQFDLFTYSFLPIKKPRFFSGGAFGTDKLVKVNGFLL